MRLKDIVHPDITRYSFDQAYGDGIELDTLVEGVPICANTDRREQCEVFCKEECKLNTNPQLEFITTSVGDKTSEDVQVIGPWECNKVSAKPLSKGAIAGISIACIVVVAVIVVVVVLVVLKKRLCCKANKASVSRAEAAEEATASAEK